MDETNERVTTIEDHLDMPHTKENSFHFQQELLRFLTSYAGHFLLCNLYPQTPILVQAFVDECELLLLKSPGTLK